MKYQLTRELVTGHDLIDAEHRELFTVVNDLLDACAQGKGCDHIRETAEFLNDYVVKHFGNEEVLQEQSRYPGYNAHKRFHEGYRRQLADVTKSLLQQPELTVKDLVELNQIVAVLVSHIRIEDKRLAQHIHRTR